MASSILNKVKSVLFKEIPPIPKIIQKSSADCTREVTASKLLNGDGKWRTAQFVIDSDWKDVRLDRILSKKFEITASLAQKLIRTRKVWIERGVEAERIVPSPSLRPVVGDSINLSEIFLPAKKEKLAPLSEADETHLRDWTLHESEELLVLNKPSGMAVHSGPGVQVSIDGLLARRSDGGEYRIVHRLDRHTSGVLLVGKTRSGTEALQTLFKTSSASALCEETLVADERPLRKTYLALVAGTPSSRTGRINSVVYKAKRPIGPGSAFEPQMTTERSKRADLLDEGQVAVTDYRMISSHMAVVGGVRVKLSLMEFVPLTGRTHQIRVHAAEQLNCPIVGDSRYGLTTIYNLNQIPGIGHGLHLHCKSIEFSFKESKEFFEAPLPKHFIKTIHKFPIRIKPPKTGYKGK
jgi:23S rRNA pseudouridine955/2504/2580 synthase